MSPEKYNRVKEIFLAACDRPDDERFEFVEKAAEGDEEIKREVRSLLGEHARDVQVIPADPESPLGSMSAILSRAQMDILEEREKAQREGVPEGVEIDPPRRDAATQPLDDSTPSNPSSGFIDAGRFMAGTVVAGRYRIIELLGRGGMGEVYRADDITLNQSIALKFLPPLFGADVKWLERFHNEVRLARQVTHPNVCRVFDIGEFQGDQFISMEYVDGENLASLLRRIGRVPHDKAVQIARQLCTGLAAAHDRGVLHRDLKPANVMIDGRGYVRITDFGLAAPADQMRKETLRAGTPAYMSPEQLGGKAVTVRSDIYSLGLVLYEMFTGRRAFKGDSLRDYKKLHTTEDPKAPSEIVEDIDPIVERVILRCLEKDPKMRPASAMAVAAALPGGNPLREILDAGETPSPEVVAAAGEAHGGLRTRMGMTLLVMGVLSLLAVVLMAPRAFIVQGAIKETPPAALAFQAHKILGRLGYADVPRDSAQGFAVDQSYYIEVQGESEVDRWKLLSRARPGLISYWYRQSPELLVPWHAEMQVAANDPPSGIPGMVRVSLDPQGHLIGLEANPVDAPNGVMSSKGGEHHQPMIRLNSQGEVTLEEVGGITPDWAGLLFQADVADIEWGRLTAVEPVGLPPVFADRRAAWAVALESAIDKPLHIEAASYRGRIVWFSVTGDWKKYSDDAAEVASRGSFTVIFQTCVIIILLLAGCTLAYRNYRSGRGDRKGATRMGLGFLLLGVIAWVFRAHHVADFSLEFRMFTRAMGAAMYNVGLVWIFYLALEPSVRRIWPETVISWSRMLNGRWIDPLVGRDVLIGSVVGIISMVITTLDLLGPQWFNLPAPMPNIYSVLQMLQSSTNYSTLFTGAIGALYLGLVLLFFIVLIRLMLLRVGARSKLLIALIFIAVFVIGTSASSGNWLAQGLIAILFLFLLIRYGLVAIIFCLFARNLLLEFPITYDFSVWYAPSAMVAISAVLVILLVSAYAALGGRPIITLRSPGA